MRIACQIAQHLREVHAGGNWTGVDLNSVLEDVDWKLATRCVGLFHSIATLVFHMNYFVSATLSALEQGRLEADDKQSFMETPVESAESWESLKQKTTRIATTPRVPNATNPSGS